MFQMLRFLMGMLLSLLILGNTLPVHLHALANATASEDAPVEESELANEVLATHQLSTPRIRLLASASLSDVGPARRMGRATQTQAAGPSGHRLPHSNLLAPLRL